MISKFECLKSYETIWSTLKQVHREGPKKIFLLEYTFTT